MKKDEVLHGKLDLEKLTILLVMNSRIEFCYVQIALLQNYYTIYAWCSFRMIAEVSTVKFILVSKRFITGDGKPKRITSEKSLSRQTI